MTLDVTHQKSNEANEKTPQGVSHMLRWMAGRVARPNPAKDYVWNASDPTDDLSPLLDMEDILGDDEDMTDRECAHFISTFFQNLSSPSLSLCVCARTRNSHAIGFVGKVPRRSVEGNVRCRFTGWAVDASSVGGDRGGR